MALIDLDHTVTLSMTVSDRHASAQWYADMLGFSLLFHADDAGWTEMATNTPGLTLGFGTQAPVATSSTIPVFGVADIATARAALEAAGVAFDGPTETMEGMVALSTLFDPDNNKLMLAQNLMQGA
ncbi:VOC family protein [Sulfitobacter sp. HNIBRBA2951]|uniref:VOC family protein n=1 Tax=Sulfitobacter aquimarinus TaxID=3158557 RepID=UPI0032DE5574